MYEETIALPISECRAILLRNWDLLSDETRTQLRSIGISPNRFGKPKRI